MFLVDRLALIGAVLLLVGIVSSKFSSRIGLPVLVLFLFVGMLAGSEGIGGIAFDSYGLAHGIGSLALAVILFDGGLRTPMASVRRAWAPALSLATVGVLLTTAITGAAASFLLGITLLEGMLLGAIVGSTDAAAVFSVLRSQGLRLSERLGATLELESGSNDPMAIFLTIGLLQVLLGAIDPGAGLARLFVLQMGVGAIVGLAVGHLAVRLINRINLAAAGLYPVLTGVCGLLAFGLAANLGGSGFLAIYIAGIVLGNTRLVFQRGSLLFHDGLAWVGQIVMFVVLGLLSYPSGLVAVAWEGLALAGVLIFVARPLAVLPTLLPFGFHWRELVLLSWAGLKGAVPIILATYPLLLGLDGSVLLFNIVFFVVIVSAVTQGWTLPWLARRLGLQQPAVVEPPVTLEITSLQDVDADIVEYTVVPDSRAAGRRLNELLLPDGVVVALVSRGPSLVPPRGSTRVDVGDHVFVVLHPDTRALVDRVFGARTAEPEAAVAAMEFIVSGAMTAGELWDYYGVRVAAPGDLALDSVLRERLGVDCRPGDWIMASDVRLQVRELIDGRIDRIALAIPEGRYSDARLTPR